MNIDNVLNFKFNKGLFPSNIEVNNTRFVRLKANLLCWVWVTEMKNK